ncbi:MAG: hypothetical protein SVM80_05435 [Halobacteriota archaeon]|nr:hypothetical protein [Halobacteriota archaeon]
MVNFMVTSVLSLRDISDRILVCLKEENWRSIEDIAMEMDLSDEQINQTLTFLSESGLVEVSKERKVKIKDFGLKLLEMPTD